MIYIENCHWFEKDILYDYRALVIWGVADKENNHIGTIYIDWILEEFRLGFKFSIGKTGIRFNLSLWFSFGFDFSWEE